MYHLSCLCRGLNPKSASNTVFLGDQFLQDASWIQSVELDLSGMDMLEIVILAIPVYSQGKEFQIETVCKGILSIPSTGANKEVFHCTYDVELFLTANNKWEQFSSKEAVETLSRLPCIGKLCFELSNSRKAPIQLLTDIKNIDVPTTTIYESFASINTNM